MIEKIGDITKRVLESLNIVEKNERDFDIEVVWNKIIDEKLIGHSYVNGIKDNILYIKVDSSCYLSLLNMKKKEILKCLNNKGFNIKKIIIKL